MKTVTDILQEIQAGNLIAIGEYRSSRCEKIQWRDKDTQRILQGVTLSHAVELGNDSAIVSERVPDEFSVKDFTPPFTKGTPVAIRIQGYTVERGVPKFRGTIEQIDLNGNGKPKVVAAPAAK